MIEQARERISDPAIPPPGSRPPCLLAPAREAIVLVVEDDDLVGEVVARYLRRDGYAVEVARDGPSALRLAARVCPDLVVLDLGLPGMHGLDVLRRLREEALTPVIVLSALGRESDLITGLETGADDYLAKPFSMEEMVARVRTVLRRCHHLSEERELLVESGPIAVDLGSRTVRVRGEVVSMPARELDLLLYFLRHPREAIRRETLLERVWGYSTGGTSTVTVHVRHLREKIELDPSAPVLLTTLWGVGYRFDPPEDAVEALHAVRV